VVNLLSYILPAVFAITCYYDVRFLRIPNWVILLLIVLYGIDQWGGTSSLSPPIHETWLTVVISFILCLILYSTRIIGAGDAKLLPTTMLWLGQHQIYPFVMAMAITGGILAVITIGLSRIKPELPPLFSASKWLAGATDGGNQIPYGVAISGGFLIVFYLF
jgi:prepilin peptidase CpaA